jgi:hypothetical protein
MNFDFIGFVTREIGSLLSLYKTIPTILTADQKTNIKSLIASLLMPVIQGIVPQVSGVVSTLLGGSAPVGGLIAEVLREIASHLESTDQKAIQAASAPVASAAPAATPAAALNPAPVVQSPESV